jgi:CubicO group peptidase (beta-lactamase class C family)
MLLTHTSSLRDNWLVLEGTWVVDRDYPLSTRDSIEAYFRPGGSLYSASRNFQSWAPGTRHRYANVGFALLALVAESAAKVPFEKLARERVLAPLAIVGGYRLDDVKGRRVAVPHRWTADLGFERLGHHGYLDYASGTLRTSATGLARFLQAYQSGGALDGARILKEATVADILRVQFPDMDDEQGLGWALDTIDGQRFWGHDGGDPGVATQMYFRPSDGVGFVLLLNAEPRGRDAERRFVDRLLAIGAREPTATRPAGERQD